MQVGALNKHLQPETADLVHRSEAEQEADNRRMGVSEEANAATPESADPFDAAGGLQPEPETDVSNIAIKTRIPRILQVPEALQDLGAKVPGGPELSIVQLHLYQFQVSCDCSTAPMAASALIVWHAWQMVSWLGMLYHKPTLPAFGWLLSGV